MEKIGEKIQIQTPLKPIQISGNQLQGTGLGQPAIVQNQYSAKKNKLDFEITLDNWSENKKGQRTDSTNVPTPFTKEHNQNTQNCFPVNCKTYVNFEKNFQNNYEIPRKTSEFVR